MPMLFLLNHQGFVPAAMDAPHFYIQRNIDAAIDVVPEIIHAEDMSSCAPQFSYKHLTFSYGRHFFFMDFRCGDLAAVIAGTLHQLNLQFVLLSVFCEALFFFTEDIFSYGFNTSHVSVPSLGRAYGLIAGPRFGFFTKTLCLPRKPYIF